MQAIEQKVPTPVGKVNEQRIQKEGKSQALDMTEIGLRVEKIHPSIVRSRFFRIYNLYIMT